MPQPMPQPMSPIGDILDLTAALIRFRSTDTRPEERERCAAHIRQWCDREGMACTRLDHEGIPSLIIGPANRHAPLLFMAHFDVVEGPDALFEPVLEGGVLHGRGSIDDKYAVALSLVIFRDHLRMLKAEGRTQDDMPLQLLLTGDEETGGYNGARHALGHVTADFCVALDGGSPAHIITKEKGIIDCTLTAHGRAAHGARPWMGVNAVDNLMDDYAALKGLFPGQRNTEDPEHWHRSLNLGILRAGSAVNQVPDMATAWLDVRYTEHDDPERLFADMRDTVRGDLAATRVEPVFHAGSSPWLDRLLACAPWASTGFAHGASDARFLSEHGIPGVVWGAEGETSQHGPEEHLLVDSLVTLHKALEAFVLAAGQEVRTDSPSGSRA